MDNATFSKYFLTTARRNIIDVQGCVVLSENDKATKPMFVLFNSLLGGDDNEITQVSFNRQSKGGIDNVVAFRTPNADTILFGNKIRFPANTDREIVLNPNTAMMNIQLMSGKSIVKQIMGVFSDENGIDFDRTVKLDAIKKSINGAIMDRIMTKKELSPETIATEKFVQFLEDKYMPEQFKFTVTANGELKFAEGPVIKVDGKGYKLHETFVNAYRKIVLKCDESETSSNSSSESGSSSESEAEEPAEEPVQEPEEETVEEPVQEPEEETVEEPEVVTSSSATRKRKDTSSHKRNKKQKPESPGATPITTRQRKTNK